MAVSELEYLQKELKDSQDFVSFCLVYDKRNKKFLTAINGDDAVIEKMITRAITTNSRATSLIKKSAAILFENFIPKGKKDGEKDFFDLFDRFRH